MKEQKNGKPQRSYLVKAINLEEAWQRLAAKVNLPLAELHETFAFWYKGPELSVHCGFRPNNKPELIK